MLVLPLIAVVLFTADLLWERRILRQTRIPIGTYLVYTSAVLTVFGVIGLIVTGQSLQPHTFSTTGLVVVGLLGLFSVGRNITYYAGFRRESLTKVDIFLILQPLAVITIAAALFPNERHPGILIAAVVASSALFFSHLRHRQLSFDRYERSLVFYILLSGLEAAAIKASFTFFSPLAVYTIRIFLVLIASLVIFGPQQFSFQRRFMRILPAMVLSFFGYAVLYWSYQRNGLVVSNMVFLLQPVLLFAIAREYFHERQPLRLAVAGTAIFFAVTYVFVLRLMS